MPIDIVTVDVTTQTSGFPQVTFGEVMVVGRTGTGAANTPVQFFSKDAATTTHGSSSDIPSAIATLRTVGAPFGYGIRAAESSRSETFAASSSGTLASTGIINPDATGGITVTVDGNAKTLSYTTADPVPAPAANSAILNTRTKKWKTAESGSVVWTFKTFDEAAIEAAIADTQYEIITFADLRADIQNYGMLFWLKTFADAQEKMWCFATANAMTRANAQLLSGNLTSVNGVGVAHKSSSDVGMTVAGLMAVKKPWITLLWKEMLGITQTTFYLKSEVGNPDTINTFEGGDGTGTGPMNVVINIGGTRVLSNGLTTAGISSAYPFADVRRTRNFMVRRLKAGLQALRLRQEKIPFTVLGLALVEANLRAEMENLVTVGALSSYTLEMPQLAAISTTDKANRKLAGIKINAVLAGDVHSFEVKLNITV